MIGFDSPKFFARHAQKGTLLAGAEMSPARMTTLKFTAGTRNCANSRCRSESTSSFICALAAYFFGSLAIQLQTASSSISVAASICHGSG